MENTASIEPPAANASNHDEVCEVIKLIPEHIEVEPLFTNFVDEIDAWARQALAANGFGDY